MGEVPAYRKWPSYREKHPVSRDVRTAMNEFRVWQIGNAYGWEVGILEIADAVGLSPSGVRAICQRKGWSPIPDNDEDVLPVDMLMEGRHPVQDFVTIRRGTRSWFLRKDFITHREAN